MADQWTDRIASHPVISLLDEVSALIDGAPQANPNATVEAGRHMQRAQAVVSAFRARLRGTPAALIPLEPLNNAATSLQEVQSQLQAFLGNNDEGHLANAQEHVDSLLVQLASLPSLPFRREADIAAKAAEDYADHLLQLREGVGAAFAGLQQQMDAQSASFTEAANDSERRVEDATKAAEGRLDHLSEAAEQHAAEIVTDSQAKIEQLRAEIDKEKARLDTAIAQHQENFASAQERRLKEFNETQEKRETAFVERTDAVSQEMRAKLQSLVDAGQASAKELKEHETRAAQIVGVAAASSVAGGYHEQARRQEEQANRWRMYSVVTFAAFMLYAVVILVSGRTAGDMSAAEWLSYSVVRAPFGFVLGGMLSWVLGQAKQHRRREEEAERLARELTAFRPFLSEVPEQERHKEIIEATKRYFPGQQPQSPSEGP